MCVCGIYTYRVERQPWEGTQEMGEVQNQKQAVKEGNSEIQIERLSEEGKVNAK